MSEPNTHEPENNRTDAQASPLDIQWAYSGKAMRAECILYWLITFVFLIGGIYFSVTGKLGAIYPWTWVGISVILAVIWIRFTGTYLYRTWTIRYRLTETRLYSEVGLFNKITDSMELVYIDDIQLQQTLFDRLINGGVGRLVIFSSGDKTHPTEKNPGTPGKSGGMPIIGIDHPREIFNKLDTARAKVRAKRAILSN